MRNQKMLQISFMSAFRLMPRSNFLAQVHSNLFPKLPSYHRVGVAASYCTSTNTSSTEAENPHTGQQFRYLRRRDERKQHPPETSIRYLESEAYKEVYGEEPVWVPYRRNFKGQYPPRKTRKSCTIGGKINTGNPCPICRDEYLTIHYTNVKLLQQFISPHTDQIYEATKTGVCQKQYMNLCIAIEKARDEGLITFQVPFRYFDYKEFYPWVKPKKAQEATGSSDNVANL